MPDRSNFMSKTRVYVFWLLLKLQSHCIYDVRAAICVHREGKKNIGVACNKHGLMNIGRMFYRQSKCQRICEPPISPGLYTDIQMKCATQNKCILLPRQTWPLCRVCFSMYQKIPTDEICADFVCEPERKTVDLCPAQFVKITSTSAYLFHVWHKDNSTTKLCNCRLSSRAAIHIRVVNLARHAPTGKVRDCLRVISANGKYESCEGDRKHNEKVYLRDPSLVNITFQPSNSSRGVVWLEFESNRHVEVLCESQHSRNPTATVPTTTTTYPYEHIRANNKSGGNNQLSTGGAAATSTVFFAAAVLLIVTVIYCRKKKRSNKSTEGNVPLTSQGTEMSPQANLQNVLPRALVIGGAIDANSSTVFQNAEYFAHPYRKADEKEKCDQQNLELNASLDNQAAGKIDIVDLYAKPDKHKKRNQSNAVTAREATEKTKATNTPKNKESDCVVNEQDSRCYYNTDQIQNYVNVKLHGGQHYDAHQIEQDDNNKLIETDKDVAFDCAEECEDQYYNVKPRRGHNYENVDLEHAETGRTSASFTVHENRKMYKLNSVDEDIQMSDNPLYETGQVHT